MQTKRCYILLSLFFVLLTKNNFAQQSLDSVQHLDSVTVLDFCILSVTKFKHATYLINNIQKQYASQHTIEDILQTTTPVQINSYGTGNVSSVSIRGANDDHTNVFWNGLKLNSLTLGGTDISLIPMESGDMLSVETNGNSFGGNINIQSKPDWNIKYKAGFRSDINSFDNFRNTLNIILGNRKVQYHATGFYQQARNNFVYTDKYKFNEPLDTMNHNELRSYAVINTFHLLLKNQQSISFGNWYQFKDKNVPNIMGLNSVSSKNQIDNSIKSFFIWKKSNQTKYDLELNFSHVYDQMKYTDKLLPTDTFLFINSFYRTHRISNSFTSKNYFKYNLQLLSGYTYNILYANVREYAKKAIDHVGEVFSELEYNYRDQLVSSFKITQPFSSFKFIRPQFSSKIAYKIPTQKYEVQVSYTDKYRFPDLNDRYWYLVGDKNLKPEIGWTVELANKFLLFPNPKSRHNFSGNINVYYTKIKNNIIWTPINAVLWSPKNLKITQLYGIESKLNYNYNNKNLLVNANVIYNFNRAQILEDEDNIDLKGNFLRYKPQHTFKTNFYAEQKYIGIGLNYVYTSSKFTDEENFKYFVLKPYHLLDVFITFKVTIKYQHTFQFIFKINNVTNTVYESVRSYAQPLRNYSISFIYNFSKLQNNSQ